MARTKRSQRREEFDYHIDRMMLLDRIVNIPRPTRRRLARKRCKKLCKVMIKAGRFLLEVTTCIKVVNFCIRHGMAKCNDVVGSPFEDVVRGLEWHCTEGISFFHDDRIFSPTSLF